MIVLESRKLAIITPPHTASRHLHAALCSPRFGGLYVLGPAPDLISIDHHFTRLSEEWAGFKIALVVRDPRTRLMGLFRHLNWWLEGQRHDPMRWPVFVRLVARDDFTSLSWLYRFTIQRLVGELAPDDVLRFESLQDDLDSLLGEHVELNGAYAYDQGTASPVWNKQLLRIAANWINEDAKWGYPLVNPKHSNDPTSEQWSK